jgi:hypothetical protein
MQPQKDRKPKWPGILGAVSVAMSVLGLSFVFLTRSMAENLLGIESIGKFCSSSFLSLLLLAGGILLIQRNSGAMKLLKAWAILHLGLVALVVPLVVGVYLDARHKASLAQGKYLADWALSNLTALGISSIFPAFVLIWVTRRFARRDLSKW